MMKAFSVLSIAVMCAELSAVTIPADTAKLAAVASGEVREAKASWWGYDSEDSTAQLLAALSSGVKTLTLDKQAGNWVTAKTLNVPSGLELLLEEGVTLEAKRGAFKGKGENLLQMRKVRNIAIRGLGKGATVKMQKADYVSKDYQWSTHRHCIALYGCENVIIENLVSRDSGGDGIYLADSGRGFLSQNIVIRDVVCDSNYRQGVSVIVGVNVIMENVKMINTFDTPPSAGIDFEPNSPDVEQIYNFILRDCLFENNKGCGIDMYLQQMTAKSGPLGVTFENCVSRGNKGYELKLHINNTDLKRMDGHVTFRNCTFEDNVKPLALKGTGETGPRITFENTTLKNIPKVENTVDAPFSAMVQPEDDGSAGNIHFKNVTVYDSVDREPFKLLTGNVGVGGIGHVDGSIKTVVNGKETTYSYDDAWAAKTYPKRDYTPVALVPMELGKIAPMQADASVTTSWKPMQMRDSGRWLIYGKAGESLSATVCIGMYGGKKICKMSMSLLSPKGKTLLAAKYDKPGTNDIKVEKLPVTGLYQLVFKDGKGTWAGVSACNRPAVMDLKDGKQNLVSGGGSGYILVPAGRDVAIRMFGDGSEGIGASIYAPDGARLFDNKGFVFPEELQLLKGKAKSGIYKVAIRKPVGIQFFEDHFINIFGVPSLLAPVPEYVFIER